MGGESLPNCFMTDEEVTRLLESLKKRDAYFRLIIGNYHIDIFSFASGDHDPFLYLNELITAYDLLYVYVYEFDKYIKLEADSRFKDYKPIKYSDIQGYSDGDKMPLSNLYELVKYLFRLK